MKRINFQKLRREDAKLSKSYQDFGEKIFLSALRKQALEYQNFKPEIMEEAYLRFYERVFVNSARLGLRSIRETNQKSLIPEYFFLTSWKAWIRDYVMNDIVMRELITKVNERTLKEIAIALADGIERGITETDLVKSIVNYVGSRSRAKGIAVTEATRATALGKKKSSEDWEFETGQELWKLWVHSKNPREPRNNHIDLQNKPIPKDQPFENGLDIPGDPTGPPSETVRCGCTVVYISKDYVKEYFPQFV
jgi:hypothetical protein